MQHDTSRNMTEATIMKNIRRLCVLLGLISLGLSGTAQAQQESAKQLYIVTYVDVYPTLAADAAKLLQQFASDSRKDSGNVRFEVMRDVARQNHFAVVEVWQNQKSFEAHSALAHTKAFREKIQPNLGSPFDERLYNVLP